MTKNDNPTRVLVIVRWPLGGVRTHILYTYASLAQVGYRFTFVVPGLTQFTSFREEVECWDGTETVEAPAVGEKCSFWVTVRRLLRQKRFDIIHTHGLTAVAPVVLANLGIGVPHVVTSHGVFREDQFSGLAGKIKLRATEAVLRRVNTFVAVSNDVRDNHFEYLPRLRKGPCHVVTIVNGIDLTRLDSATEETELPLRRQLGLEDDVYLMGFLGRCEPEKGFIYLLEAMDKVLADEPWRRCHLVAVGRDECPNRMRPELARRPRAAKRITFLGHVPNVAPVLKELDLLVMPSISEACPLLPMEAMCMGVPVLGFDSIGLREVLKGTPSRTVLTGNAAALAEAIRHAMEDPFTEQARRYACEARSRFDVRHCSRQLADTFDRLTGYSTALN